jgi:hypothetical protein
MNGLLGWGGSNYPGETFLSPAPRLPPADAEGLAWEEVAGRRRSLRQAPPLLRPRLLLLTRPSKLSSALPQAPPEKTRSPGRRPASRTFDSLQKGLWRKRGLRQGPKCCPRVV